MKIVLINQRIIAMLVQFTLRLEEGLQDCLQRNNRKVCKESKLNVSKLKYKCVCQVCPSCSFKVTATLARCLSFEFMWHCTAFINILCKYDPFIQYIRNHENKAYLFSSFCEKKPQNNITAVYIHFIYLTPAVTVDSLLTNR